VSRIDRGDDLAPVRDANLVLLAAPALTNIALLRRLRPLIRRDGLVTDVSGSKRRITAEAEALSMPFIGGHPMAGAARGGAVHARADLFERRPWILTPPPSHDAAALNRLERFAAACGGAPHVMTPELHDRLVGAVSHLPQLTASALMHVVGSLAGDQGLELAGAGLRDSTRLASSPADIWRDIAATNDDVLRAALDALIRTLTELRDSLSQGDALDAVFTSASRWREALDRGDPPQQ
jgi:prephenate dehydrogenase